MNTYLLMLSEILGVVAVTMIAGTSRAFRQRRRLDFVYPRRELVVSLTLFGLALVVALVVFSSGGAQAAGEGIPAALWQRLTAALGALLPFTLALLVRRQPWRSAGWNREMFKPALRLGLALAFLSIFLRGKIFALLGGLSAAEGLSLLLWALIALAEETIFRGYIQLRLNSTVGEERGWLLSALLFALWALPRAARGDLAGAAIAFGVALAQGLVSGWVMRRCGHVAAPILYRAVSEWLTLLV